MVARGSKKRVKRIVPVSDGAGEIIEVGGDVRRLAIGDRVAAAFFPTWIDGAFAEEHHANALGGSLDGMLAEEVVLPERAWVKMPVRYTFEQASTLPCAAVTAWHALFEAATVRPGETVLVQGGGGVSTFALQLARHAGASVIATSSSADKRARLTEMGAASTIDYKRDAKWGETARAAAKDGVDLVVEVGGAGTFDQSVAALRYGGHIRTSASAVFMSARSRCSSGSSARSSNRPSIQSSIGCFHSKKRAPHTSTWRAALILARSSFGYSCSNLLKGAAV
jgi:NADPH:quinone reductase-like Zn-dependent oxidoreductase